MRKDRRPFPLGSHAHAARARAARTVALAAMLAAPSIALADSSFRFEARPVDAYTWDVYLNETVTSGTSIIAAQGGLDFAAVQVLAVSPYPTTPSTVASASPNAVASWIYGTPVAGSSGFDYGTLSANEVYWDTTLALSNLASPGVMGTVNSLGGAVYLGRFNFTGGTAGHKTYFKAAAWVGDNTYTVTGVDSIESTHGIADSIIFSVNDSSNSSSTGGGSSVTGTDLQVTSPLLDQSSLSLASMKILGANDVSLAPGATLTLADGGLYKHGGGAATVTGGAAITAGLNAPIYLRADSATDQLTISTPLAANGTNHLGAFGSGRIILAAANTYTGTTTVSGGILLVNGSLGAGTVSIASGTLGGTGAVAGPVIVLNGGTLTAADAGTAGILTTGAMTWSAGGTYLVDIQNAALGSGSGVDLLTISSLTGPDTSLGKFNIRIALGDTPSFDSNAAYSWVIAHANSGNFGSDLLAAYNIQNTTGAPGTFSLRQASSGGGTDLILDYSAAPELSTLTLTGGVALMAFLTARRRRLPK